MPSSTRHSWTFGVSDFSTSEPLHNAGAIIAAGMDFIEPGLAKVAAMPEEEFLAAADRIKASGIRVQSMNWFLPPSVKVTGPEVDEAKSREFLTSALGRAQRLGAKAVVFGSPGSRSVPAGFSTAVAKEQMIAFCRLCAEVIRENRFDMKIAVEPVNHHETNFINTFAEALKIVREVNRAEIGLAADFYHFSMEHEATDIMLEAPGLICAVQLANPGGRCFPKPGTEVPGLRQFFEHLAAVRYQGGLSVEANVGDDLIADCRDAVAFLSALRQQIA
jgi:D-psicose/D-tagatose/L-ribulose 3-epimerase